MPAARRVPRARREQQILDVATRAFGEAGYEDASMDRIAKEVGVTKPIIYAYFGSKEGLFDACATRAWRAMGEAIYDAASAPGAPDLRVWRGIVAYFDFIDRHRHLWRVIYPELAPGGERAGRRLTPARRGAVHLMAELLMSGAEEEGVAPDVVAMGVPIAQAFVGAATALAGWWLEHPDEPKELQAARLMNFTWQGLGDLMRGDLWLPPPEG